MTAKDYVTAGAKLLDEKCPGWVQRIDLDNLIMASCHQCVLGQLYQNYWNGCDKLGLSPDMYPDAYGFCCNSLANYCDLRVAWTDLIIERLARKEATHEAAT